jgi:hypothetical protein
MKKILIPIMAGALMITAALPLTADARRGGGEPMRGNFIKAGYQDRDRLRLRDGSCLNANKTQARAGFKKGNRFGPGNGSGNAGAGPKDGTGYGAPSNR